MLGINQVWKQRNADLDVQKERARQSRHRRHCRALSATALQDTYSSDASFNY